MSFDLSIFKDAAPFIRITDEKRLNLVSDQIEKFKPPSGAKVVWCPTPEDPAIQYTRASWSETKNGMAQLVRFDNKQVWCLINQNFAQKVYGELFQISALDLVISVLI